MNPIHIIALEKFVVKSGIAATLVFGLAALGSLNIPCTVTAVLALNALCGIWEALK